MNAVLKILISLNIELFVEYYPQIKKTKNSQGGGNLFREINLQKNQKYL